MAERGYARELPYEDGRFDAALLLGPLYHLHYEALVEQDLRDGRHSNPENHPRWFTTAYFHLPEDLPGELEDAGLRAESVLAIQGPAGIMVNLGDHMNDPERRERLLRALERVEAAPSLLGVSAHLLAVGRR